MSEPPKTKPAVLVPALVKYDLVDFTSLISVKDEPSQDSVVADKEGAAQPVVIEAVFVAPKVVKNCLAVFKSPDSVKAVPL